MVRAILIVGMCLVAFPGGAVSDPERELDLSLVGTVLSESGKMLAIIQAGESGEQELYWLGDVIAGGRLTNILHDRVTLSFAGSEIELFLSGSAGGNSEAVANTNSVQPPLRRSDNGFWHIDRETRDQLSLAPEMTAQVTSLGTGGVRVDKVQADGLFHALGLQRHDIIRRINGRVPRADLSLNQEIAQTVAMGQLLMQVEVDRRGYVDTVYYEIDP